MLVPIIRPKLLVAEGADEVYLFSALMEHIGVNGIQIHQARGKDNFRPWLQALVQVPEFSSVVSLGLVRDADVDAASAFQSMQDSLMSVGLPAPSEPLQPFGLNPRVIVLILPHGNRTGALEDVCLASVADDPAMRCVDGYFNCIQDGGLEPSDNLSKARLQAFLASRPRSGLLLGQAASAGYWKWEHPAFEPLKQLLQML
jgi:hypothetical protein